MKKLLSILLVILVVLTSFAACGEKSESEESEKKDKNEKEKAETTEVVETPDESIENLNYDSFSFSIDGEIYTLPAKYTDFIDNGFVLDESYSVKDVESGSYESVKIKNSSNDSFWIYVKNFDNCTHSLDECYVISIEFQNIERTDILLPQNISYKNSTSEDIANTYGEPQEKYEDDDSYYRYSYYVIAENGVRDSNKYYNFYFYNDSNYIESIKIYNNTTPNDFKYSEIDTDSMIDYEVPTVLGSTSITPVFSLFGKLYSLPCPVSEFIDNGWNFSEYSSNTKNDEVNSGKSSYIVLYSGDFRISINAKNITTYSNILYNCIVTSITVDTTYTDNMSKFPEMFDFGSAVTNGEDNFVKHMKTNNFNYKTETTEENGDKTVTYTLTSTQGDYDYTYVLTFFNGTVSQFKLTAKDKA